MAAKKFISIKALVIMALLALGSVFCFFSSAVILYYSGFNIENYFNLDKFNNISINRFNNEISHNEIYSTNIDLSEIDNLNVDLHNYSVFLKTYEGDTLSISAYSDEDLNNNNNGSTLIKSEVNNKTLTLTSNYNVDSLEKKDSLDFVINIPRNFKNNLACNILTGNISLKNIYLGDISIKSTDSSIELDSITTKSLSLFTINGNVSTSNLFCQKTSISIINGDINTTELSGTIELSAVNGNIFTTLSNDFKKLDASTTSGDIRINSLNENLVLHFNTTNGNFKSNNNDLFSNMTQTNNGRNTTFTLGNGQNKIQAKTINGNLFFSM